MSSDARRTGHGEIELPSATAEITVPFHDLDPMGIAWHGRYPKYFEAARDLLLDQVGFTHAYMRDSGYLWPVIDMRVQYVKPARLKQKLLVTATVREYEYRLKIRYEIRDSASGKRVTKGYTVQVAVRASDGAMMMSSPAVLTRLFGPSPAAT